MSCKQKIVFDNNNSLRIFLDEYSFSCLQFLLDIPVLSGEQEKGLVNCLLNHVNTTL